MAFLSAMRVSALTVALSAAQHVLAAPASMHQRQASAIPSFALEFAPVVWLQSSETFFPGPLAAQLVNTVPELNFEPVAGTPNPLTLDNLDQLNSVPNATNVFLTSIDNVAAVPIPAWLNGFKPDSTGLSAGGINNAIIVADKANGTVDVFYMYFYPYNQGNTVLGEEFGDHVGDWEHTMIRFLNGVPQAMWFSQHSSGQAFTYEAVEKQGVRPVVYSAQGDHANYAISGVHSHGIPGINFPFPVLLNDETDQGTLWDPTLSAGVYEYSVADNTFTPFIAGTPTAWLNWVGAWGDEQYPLSDPRQSEILGISLTLKYTSGPTGPIDKDLARTDVCPDGNEGGCNILPVLIAR